MRRSFACKQLPSFGQVMGLVDYPDSDDSIEPSNQPTLDDQPQSVPSIPNHKRKRSEDHSSSPTSLQAFRLAPPLPCAFASLYAGNVRSGVSDDPALHGGRQRQVLHVTGSWPSFVYLEWTPSEHDMQKLEAFISAISKRQGGTPTTQDQLTRIHSSLRSDLGVRLPLHISLSTSMSLGTDNKDAFGDDLSDAIQQSHVTSFKVSISRFRWVKNFNNTRYFLVLTLNKPIGNELQQLLSTCNRVVGKYQMPQLYAKQELSSSIPGADSIDIRSTTEDCAPVLDEQFHISIAWSLSEPEDDEKNDNVVPEDLKPTEISFDSVLLKIGNSVSILPLRRTPNDGLVRYSDS